MDEQLQIKTEMDFAVKKVLEALSMAIMALTNAGKDQELTFLQACCGKLFQRAAECRSQNKQMVVIDDSKDSLH